MDRPEILRVLFHPVQTPHNSPPPDATDLTVEVAPDVAIGCRLFKASADAPVLLFFHGNGETVVDYDDVGPSYQHSDLNFLVTDYRGYGWSTGTPLSSALLPDADLLFIQLRSWLKELGCTGKLLLMGRSLGSACAIDLANRYSEEISGLIIESGFAETLPLARLLGINLEHLGIKEEQTFNNLSKIAQFTKPTLILHGQRDHLIPLSQAEKLHAACGAKIKELQMVPGADHNTLIAVGGPLYFQTIKKFADKATGRELDWRERRRRFKAMQSAARDSDSI